MTKALIILVFMCVEVFLFSITFFSSLYVFRASDFHRAMSFSVSIMLPRYFARCKWDLKSGCERTSVNWVVLTAGWLILEKASPDVVVVVH